MPEMAILQDNLPYDPPDGRLPGVSPLQGDWLWADSAYGPQMALRRRLLRDQRERVLARTDGSEEAEAELFDAALEHAPFLTRDGDDILCPDGTRHQITGDALWDLGHILQQDFVLMAKAGEEHVLVAAVLCFPANWTLAEKLGRPLVRIHRPVEEYDTNVAARVQRLFDGVQVGRPLYRRNALRYSNPALFQPKLEVEHHPQDAHRPYLRSEHQVLWRLPQTRAVVFSIHTTQVHIDDPLEEPHGSV